MSDSGNEQLKSLMSKAMKAQQNAGSDQGVRMAAKMLRTRCVEAARSGLTMERLDGIGEALSELTEAEEEAEEKREYKHRQRMVALKRYQMMDPMVETIQNPFMTTEKVEVNREPIGVTVFDPMRWGAWVHALVAKVKETP